MYPFYRGFQNRIAPGEERFLRELHLHIRNHAHAFERFSAFGNVISHRVLEAIAIRKFVDRGWQRRARGARAKYPRTAQILHPLGEDLGSGCRASVHQNGHRARDTWATVDSP